MGMLHSLSIANLGQHVLQHLIEFFHHLISLWLIRRAFWWYTWNSSISALILSFRKRIPWSLIKIFGHPNRISTYSKRNFAAVVPVHSFIGCAFTHQVKYLVVVIMYRAPVYFPWGWMGPTKSITHFSKGCNVICGFRGSSSLYLVVSFWILMEGWLPQPCV